MKPRPRREVEPDTETWGIGPIELQCDVARCHGWTEEDLEMAARLMWEIAKKYGGRARRRYPERYRDEHGVTVFVGLLPNDQRKG